LDAGGDPFAHVRRDLAQRLGAERRAARDGREALRGAGERREAWERRAARKEARERARARLRAEGRRCGHAEREQELLHRAYGTWCSGRLRTFSAKGARARASTKVSKYSKGNMQCNNNSL
tara:strand:- start:28 stop:390 length:363 start_codon:yes stop_codon:yes gene_type:complete